MVETKPVPRFSCPACRKVSKLGGSLPSSGTYKITCVYCKTATTVQFPLDSNVVITTNPEFALETPNDTLPKQETKPFFEKRIVVEDAPTQQPRTTFRDANFNPRPNPVRDSYSSPDLNRNQQPNSNPNSQRKSPRNNPDFQTNWNFKIPKLNWKRVTSELAILQKWKDSFLQRSQQKQIEFERKKASSVSFPQSNRQARFPGAGQEARSEKKAKKSGLFGILVFGATIALISAIIVFTIFLAGVISLKKEIPERLANLNKTLPTKIYDRNGIVLSEIFQKRISTLKLADYPPELVSMLLQVEDRNFFSHSGIDMLALVRAIFTNIISLEYKQGASTITQQLARILLDNRSKSLVRKWKEAQLAFALESSLTKETILETYMNQVYLGHGAFGFGEAIKFYFNKNPRELNFEEMVLLTSLPSSPRKYSPIKESERSRKRVENILKSFQKRAIFPSLHKMDTIAFYNQFKTRSPLESVFGNRPDKAPYVTEYVREILKSLDISANIYEAGGYKIETTIVAPIQEKLNQLVGQHIQENLREGRIRKILLVKSSKDPNEKAIQDFFEDIALLRETDSLVWEERDSANTIPQSAVVGLDPATGEILFLQGGDSFSSKNQLNRAIYMRRQTGSSIKPILYSAAIDTDMLNPASKIMDAPLIYQSGKANEYWTPDNLSSKYEGEITLRTALAKSKNTAAVQVAEKLGYNTLEHYFSLFFFPDEEQKKYRYRSDLSLALGSLELSPLEMASAFSAFANSGNIVRPTLVRRIYDSNDKLVYDGTGKDEFKLRVPERRRVIEEDTAEIMVSLLKDSGRNGSVSGGGYYEEVVGKTGTTNDYKDAWFVGIKESVAVAVWIGYDEPKFGMGPGALGGTIAGPLYGKIMRELKSENLLPLSNFPPPAKLVSKEICVESGKSVSGTCVCYKRRFEYFRKTSVPSDECNLKTEVETPSTNNLF